VGDLRSRLDERYAAQTQALDAAFEAQKLSVAAALAAAEKATTKAETAADKRFEATNEFRGQLKDQAATLMSRAEAQALYDRNTERIGELADRVTRAEGHGAGANAAWIYIIGAISLMGTVFSAYRALAGK
jgi:biopolymer transport protein ExbB/TolQ